MISTMRHLFRSGLRISDQLVGDPVRVGGRTLRPVVRLTGLGGTLGSASGGGVVARLRVVPEAVILTESDGREFRVPTQENSRFAVWGLAGAALLVLLVYRLSGKAAR